MARGQVVISRLSQKKWGEIEEWLLNVIDVPPEAANDNDEDEASDDAFDRPDIIADLESRFGKPEEDAPK